MLAFELTALAPWLLASRGPSAKPRFDHLECTRMWHDTFGPLKSVAVYKKQKTNIDTVFIPVVFFEGEIPKKYIHSPIPQTAATFTSYSTEKIAPATTWCHISRSECSKSLLFSAGQWITNIPRKHSFNGEQTQEIIRPQAIKRVLLMPLGGLPRAPCRLGAV